MTEIEIYKSGLEDGANQLTNYMLDLINDGMSIDRIKIFLEAKIEQDEARKKG